MKHSFIDEHSNIDSIISRLDSRIKIISFIILILSIAFTPPDLYMHFLSYSVIILVIVLLSKIHLSFILKRSLVIIPFVLMIAVFIPFFKKGNIAGAYSFGSLKLNVSYSGLLILWNVLVKSFLSMLMMIILISTTHFVDLLKALEKLRLPKIFIMIMSFMYRYVFLFTDELLLMSQAKESRMVSRNKWLNIKTLSNMIGSLFVRSYERGERVYLSMCSRGYNGEIRTVNNFCLKNKDILFLLIIIISMVLIRIVL